MTENNRSLLYSCSRGYRSQIQVLAGPCSPWRVQRTILPSNLGVDQPPFVFLGFQLQCCGLCLWHHMAFVFTSVWVSSHKDISLIGFRVNSRGFPGGASGKESSCQYRKHKGYSFNPWVGKIPWRRKWQPTPLFLSGESHGQRSLVGYNPLGCRESDTTERLSTRCTIWPHPDLIISTTML